MLKNRPRLHPSCYIGERRYFLTFCTHDRRALFTNADVVTLVLQQILHAAEERRVAVIAYVFMPDHVHLLVEGLDASSDLTKFAHQAKQRSGHAYSQQTQARLWQPSYWDHVLRDEDPTWAVVRYICDNPVRKQLVERWEDYEFTGSAIMTKQELAREMMCHAAHRWQP